MKVVPGGIYFVMLTRVFCLVVNNKYTTCFPFNSLTVTCYVMVFMFLFHNCFSSISAVFPSPNFLAVISVYCNVAKWNHSLQAE